MPGPSQADILAALAVIAGAGALFTWLLRGSQVWGGRPSAAVLGGLMAGLLLGPAVLGRLSPDTVPGRWYEWLLLGGAEPRLDLARLDEQFDAEIVAMSRAETLAPDAAAARRHQQENDLADARERLRQARGKHSIALLTVTGFLSLFGVVLARFSRPQRPPRRSTGLIAAAAPSLLSLVPIALLATPALVLLLRLPFQAALWLGMLLGIGSVFVMPLRAGDPALRRERSLLTTGSASLAALLPALGLWGVVATIVVIAGHLGFRTGPVASRRAVRIARSLLLGVIVPAAVAAVATRINSSVVASLGWRASITVLVAWILASDGRLLFGALAARFFPVSGATPIGLAAEPIVRGSCLTQCLLLVPLLVAGALPLDSPESQAALAAVLISAAATEPAAGLYRRLGRWGTQW